MLIAPRLLQSPFRIRGLVVPDMIGDILDACREVLEINGDSQSAYRTSPFSLTCHNWPLSTSSAVSQPP
jgi:hypothetical protein